MRYFSAATLYRGLADNTVGEIVDTLLCSDLAPSVDMTSGAGAPPGTPGGRATTRGRL